MKSLLICRHAKSDQHTLLPDIERPLNPRGKRDIKRMGLALAQYGWQPEWVLTSPATRALDTAQGVMKYAKYDTEILLEPNLYFKSAQAYIDAIEQIPDDIQQAAIFGHNPMITETIFALLKVSTAPRVPTGTMALIESQANHWAQFLQFPTQLIFFQIPALLSAWDVE
jgi:phosphohistidine phosphatase